MLRAEIQGADTHMFTKEFDSVLEVPKKGDEVTCGFCGNKTTVLNVGVPYRVETNGKNYKSEGQTSVFKE